MGRLPWKADGAHVAARGVAVDGEGAADVADAGGPVRRCVAVGGRATAGGRYRRPAAGADAVQSAVPAASGSLSGGAATDATAAGPRLAGAVRPGPRGVLRAGGGSGSGSGVRLHRRERPGRDDTERAVPASAVRVGAELQQVDVCGAGAERDVRGVGVGPAGRGVDAGRGPGSAATRQPVGGDARGAPYICTRPPRVAPHISPCRRLRTFRLPVAPTRANVDGRRLPAAAGKEDPRP